MESILRITNLTKSYKTCKAVDHVNINVQKGDIYGFIGQNGAGKTTTIRLVLNLLKPSEGQVELFGEKVTNNNIYKHLQKIGSIIEIPGFYFNLTGYENLEIHRILMNVKDKSEIDRVLKIVNLNDEKRKKVKHYSLGMKQRLGIARALLHNPDLLILDEPTNGLDPSGIVQIRDLILEISRNYGKTILISSHILSEVEKMVNKIGIIHKGKLLEEINHTEILKKCKKSIIFDVSDQQKAIDIIKGHLKVPNIEVQKESIIVQAESEDLNGKIVKLLVENGIIVNESRFVVPSLENYYMKVIEEVK